MSELIGTAMAIAIAATIILVPLMLSKRSRSSYKRAALIVVATYILVLVPMLTIGTGLVAPIEFATFAPMLLLYAGVFAIGYGLWCWLVIRKGAHNG